MPVNTSGLLEYFERVGPELFAATRLQLPGKTVERHAFERIDAIGAEVPEWRPGQRVGVGWYGGHCGYCEPCRRGDFITCRNGRITGITQDGGYADYVVVPFEAMARIPDGLTAVEAAPLVCAGITTFNALRNSGARPPDLVAVLGIGGLGHLGVQFAVRMGFRTVAIARGKDKEPLARKLGAHQYIDSQAENVSEQLQKLGGAKVVRHSTGDVVTLIGAGVILVIGVVCARLLRHRRSGPGLVEGR
jgi:D-arabinose 1-dehydrogenase-like Zn-dependent alcohol dehydrogenase